MWHDQVGLAWLSGFFGVFYLSECRKLLVKSDLSKQAQREERHEETDLFEWFGKEVDLVERIDHSDCLKGQCQRLKHFFKLFLCLSGMCHSIRYINQLSFAAFCILSRLIVNLGCVLSNFLEIIDD